MWKNVVKGDSPELADVPMLIKRFDQISNIAGIKRLVQKGGCPSGIGSIDTLGRAEIAHGNKKDTAHFRFILFPLEHLETI
ncbi:MAG: hypothetical protein JWM99_708, partial [Verrucomicrobiales bacterium]|nr:hypothetical protein [Verrucomicrobiales bacterium]